jgi:hypothetical protein
MAQLSSASVELDEVRGNKDTIVRWVEDSLGKLKEIQNRPAKLRPDTAQVEMNQLQDMRQVRFSATNYKSNIVQSSHANFVRFMLIGSR